VLVYTVLETLDISRGGYSKLFGKSTIIMVQGSYERCIFRRLFIILLADVAGMAKVIQKVDVLQQFPCSSYQIISLVLCRRMTE